MNIFVNTIIDLTALLIVLLLYAGERRGGRKEFGDAIFMRMLLAMSCYIICDLFAWWVDGRSFPGNYALMMFLNTAIYLTQMLYTYLWLLFAEFWLFHSAQRIKKRHPFYAIPLIIHIILLVINIFTGCIFSIDGANQYVRGQLFLPGMLLFYCYDIYLTVLCVVTFFKSKDKERRAACLWLLAFMSLPVIASLVLALFGYGISVTAPFYALSLLMIYLNVHQKRAMEQELALARREADLQKTNTALMLSQIQPHFLFNALGSIEYLCRHDPELAGKTLRDFEIFLRGNIESLSRDTPIPFEKELDHLRHYMSIELLRFPDDLRVEYDIQTTDFNLPPLTLQPVAENAVKHGLTIGAYGGGTVKISTRREGTESIVVIEDDGAGFDTNAAPPEDGRSHIGLSNVRKRLQIMCGGSMDVQSQPGKGTRVTMRIPSPGKGGAA